jgi:hypothetical protein
MTMAYQDALLDQLDPTRKQMTAPGYQPSGTAVDQPLDTQGGPHNDPRWTNGTWGGIPTTDPGSPGTAGGFWNPGSQPLSGPDGQPIAYPGTSQVPTPANGNTGINGANWDTPQGPSAPAGGMKDYRQIFQDTMQPFGYGHDALAKGKDALAAQGIKSYVDSSGMSRGRVELPGGDRFDVFDPVEGRTESDNWQTNPQGANWGWQAMGRDAGNSAKFAGNAPPQMALPQAPLAGANLGTSQDAITAGVQQYSEPSKYLEALLAQLGGQQ